MQYEANTPSDYLSIIENDWKKETIENIRNIIKSKAPKIVEGINYKMLSYGDDRGIIFHLNAQKNYVSLYVGDIKKIDPDGSILKGMNLGKGCIRFTKSILIEETQIKEFIARAIYLWNDGEDIGC
jgi:uncharacterized protein YdhG (YjbR/CyaY superfamily)